MKQKLLLLFFAIAFSTVNSQSYNMCSTTTVSSASSGNLYDSGGPSLNYYSYDNCYFLIKTNCPANGNITLNFSSFSTEQGYDYCTIYDGNNTSAPILGSYWGTGTVPPMVATSGSMLVYFYSDGSSSYPGFAATWSFANPNCAPQANFNTNVNSCQGIVNFIDISTGSPTSWIWNFGDGAASTLQSPVHTYTAPGTYSATLVASNSQGSSTITKIVTVNPISFQIGYNGALLMNSAISFTTNNTSGQVYTWNFGDGNLAGTANSIHTYGALGTYTVSLTIASGACVTTNSLTITLKDGVGIGEYQGLAYQASVYPNPFTQETQLNIQLARDSKLKIEVVNQLGQICRVLSDESLIAGQYKFDINNLPAGVYYVNIKEGESRQTLKLISLDK